MSEFKGIKGPWVVGKTKRGHGKISAQRWAYFCKVYTLTETFTESERKIYDEISKANAQLISKAPEMLEMLKEAKRVICSMKLSMWVHPDCSEGSEFYDIATTGEETEDKIEQLIKEATTI